MAEDDGSEKPFEATPRKIEEARKRGEMPISQDLVTFGVYAAVLLTIIGLGAWSANRISVSMMPYIAAPDRLAEHIFSANGLAWHLHILGGLAPAIAIWLGIPFLFAVAVAFLQGALVFSGQKLQPKINRISPIKNAKQKYGSDGLFNFLKSFVKLTIYSLVLFAVFQMQVETIVALSALPVSESLQIIQNLCLQFLAVSAAVMFVIAIVDFLWQRAQFMHRQRMSFKEMKDELKESEGDPYTRQARRQKAYDIATNQMLADVPEADVVVVNPEHYAVALKWERAPGTAPVCVAKGVDEIAKRIREVAREHAVPIRRDPPAARSIFVTVDIGAEIPAEQYQAIAAAIRFADAMRLKARQRR